MKQREKESLYMWVQKFYKTTYQHHSQEIRDKIKEFPLEWTLNRAKQEITREMVKMNNTDNAR